MEILDINTATVAVVSTRELKLHLREAPIANHESESLGNLIEESKDSTPNCMTPADIPSKGRSSAQTRSQEAAQVLMGSSATKHGTAEPDQIRNNTKCHADFYCPHVCRTWHELNNIAIDQRTELTEIHNSDYDSMPVQNAAEKHTSGWAQPSLDSILLISSAARCSHSRVSNLLPTDTEPNAPLGSHAHRPHYVGFVTSNLTNLHSACYGADGPCMH